MPALPRPRSPSRGRATITPRQALAGVAIGAFVLVLIWVKLDTGAWGRSRSAPATATTPVRAKIVSLAQGQVGYQTTPSTTLCNKFSAYWGAGSARCPAGALAEEWCADFAAWAWKQAGATVVYGYGPDDLNGASISFYRWGVAHGTWHPADSGYTPQPGDVAVYGLRADHTVAQHVAIVTGFQPGARGPDVINGNGSKTGFSVVEPGTEQHAADIHGDGGPLAGYTSPS